MTCTTSDCDQPTDLYLCNQCVSDLQASIEYAHRLLPDLDVTIARLDVTRPGNPETRSTNVAGSAAPANMDALQLKLNMEAVTQTATQYAHDPRVAGMAWLLGEWCKSAEKIISGPLEVRVITTCQCGGKVTSESPPPQPTEKNHDPADIGTCQSCGIVVSTTKAETQQRIVENAPGPMKSKDAVKWIREHSGHKIATTDIRNWAREGAILRANEEGHPTYNVQDVLRVAYRKLASGKGRKLAA